MTGWCKNSWWEVFERLWEYAYKINGHQCNINEIKRVNNLDNIYCWKSQSKQGCDWENILKKVKFDRMETERACIDIYHYGFWLWIVENAAKYNYQHKASDCYEQKFLKDFGITSQKAQAYA